MIRSKSSCCGAGRSGLRSGVRANAKRLDLPALPIAAEESADPKEHDSGDGHADPRAEHGPVEPDGAAVIEHVDGEPNQAEGDPDPRNDVEDPLAETYRRASSRDSSIG